MLSHRWAATKSCETPHGQQRDLARGSSVTRGPLVGSEPIPPRSLGIVLRDAADPL